jgi:hypothetical protein
MSKGYVYVLSNPAMPGLVKIGMTTGRPEARAAQLSTTGVPEPFVLEAKFCCPDCRFFEAYVHAAFDGCRVGSGKEFFRIEVGILVSKMIAMHASVISDWLDEFAPNYSIVESEAFVDPSTVYFIADELGEDPQLVALALSDIRAEEAKSCVLRMKKKTCPDRSYEH